MEQIGVVLIDAHPILARIARRFIQQDRNLAVVGTTTNTNAFDYVLEQNPRVVVMDLDMSDPSILETMARLHSCLPKLHIIALTLFDLESYRQAAFNAGADAFVTKDALYTDLVPCIHRVVNAF